MLSAAAIPGLPASATSRPRDAGAAPESSADATPEPSDGATPELSAGTPAGRRFIGCRIDRTGRHLASVFDLSGRIRHDVPLPGRGHGFAAGADRHFYGHGAFSPDGAFLYTSENRFEDGAGIIGVWEAARDWRRIGEWPSHGVGPHEIRMSGRGTMLAVANGGVRTHPDTGRAKLNLDTMAPSLALMDTADSRLVRSVSFGPRLRRLSIRHLDTGRDGRILVAMQHQGARTDHVPLIAFERGGRLAPGARTGRRHPQDARVRGIGVVRRLRRPRRGFASPCRHREPVGHPHRAVARGRRAR